MPKDRYFTDLDSYYRVVPKDVVTYPTGYDDEVYYYDTDGNILHIPPRTKYSHPYSYDQIVLINTGVEPTTGAYSDRMSQWDNQKFHRIMDERNKGKTAFSWGNKDDVTAFCQNYFDDQTMEIVKVTEMCNQSNGYPFWYIKWISTKVIA